MAVSSSKFIPVIGATVALIVLCILVVHFTGSDNTSAQAIKEVPLPTTAGADQDNHVETLKTLVASNQNLADDLKRVREEIDALKQRPASPIQSAHELPPGTATGSSSTSTASASPLDNLSDAWSSATTTITGIASPESATTIKLDSAPLLDPRGGAVGYQVVAPMGYVAQTSMDRGQTTTRYVRAPPSGAVTASASNQASQAAAAKKAQEQDVPYFTLPENATLTGVTAMTSLIGRVPVNGRVTDPMQFKALIGRDNLAANGWELPDDLTGMVVTGVAIGDMALSCSEGKVRSLTFVFNDGAIRTVSSRSSGDSGNAGLGVSGGAIGSSGSSGASSSSGGDLGFISDLHGNPCIQGKFVTNAPAYLTDIIGAKGLGIAAEALAESQTTVTSGTDSSQSSVSGDAGSYALGKMGSGAADELVEWLTDRLKNSFDAVVTPSGQQLVVHLNQEVRIDKAHTPRLIVHRTQQANTYSGARYGLD